MTKRDQIDKLAQEITDNKICAELADQATQLVMGEGSLDADIVFIGEAPGKKEDELGRPFVGASVITIDGTQEFNQQLEAFEKQLVEMKSGSSRL